MDPKKVSQAIFTTSDEIANSQNVDELQAILKRHQAALLNQEDELQLFFQVQVVPMSKEKGDIG